ncbi:hypothetical protein [Alteribacillus sp. HJP-4]|uniref:hypothetical protein n=1 Tax=Alteribacillus sp. HJP-4 TaxID=2775394 RepID=UPI0035CD33BE
MSAPIAVAIAVVYGFWRYIAAGLIASSLLLMLGLHTIINVEVSMIFRMVAGGIIALFGHSVPVILLAGPAGTLAARIGLAETLQVSAWPLIIGAIPGMVFTILTVIPLIRILKRADSISSYHKKENAA